MGAPDLSQYLWPDAELGRQPSEVLTVNADWSPAFVITGDSVRDVVNNTFGTLGGGAAATIGVDGRTLSFDGSSGYASFASIDAYNITGALTLVWAGTITDYANDNMLVSKTPNNGPVDNPFTLYIKTGTGQVELVRSNNLYSVWRSAATVPLNTLVVIVVTQSGELGGAEGATCRINGVDVPLTKITYAYNGPATPTTSPLYIGRRSDGNYHKGSTALLAGFDRVLPAKERESISDNPWQIFKSPLDIGWPAIAGSGGPTTEFTTTTSGPSAAFSSNVPPVASFAITSASASAALSSGSAVSTSFAVSTESVTAVFNTSVSPVTVFSTTTASVSPVFAASVSPITAFSVTTNNITPVFSAYSSNSVSFAVITGNTAPAFDSFVSPVVSFNTVTSGGAAAFSSASGNGASFAVLSDSVAPSFSASVAPIASFSATLDANAAFSSAGGSTSTFSTGTSSVIAAFSTSVTPVAAFNATIDSVIAALSSSASSGGAVNTTTEAVIATFNALVSPSASFNLALDSSVFSGSSSTGGFSGSLSEADIARIVVAVLAALNATTIPVDTRKMNGSLVYGSGIEVDKWRGNV